MREDIRNRFTTTAARLKDMVDLDDPTAEITPVEETTSCTDAKSEQNDATQVNDREQDFHDRAPHPPDGYKGAEAFERTIGRASSTCESCGTEIDGYDLDDFLIGRIRPLDFSPESHAVVCRSCEAGPGIDWKENVRERRATHRTDSIRDQISHFFNGPPISTLFLRRLTVALSVLLIGVAAIGQAYPSVADPIAQSGPEQLVGGLTVVVVAAYYLHTTERERNDMRGTRVREFELTDPPWLYVLLGGGIMVFSTSLLQMQPAVSIGASTLYLMGAAMAFITAEQAIRADRCHPRINWTPQYNRELFILRATIIFASVIMMIDMFDDLGPLVEFTTAAPFFVIAIYATIHYWADLGENWELLYQYAQAGDGGETP